MFELGRDRPKAVRVGMKLSRLPIRLKFTIDSLCRFRRQDTEGPGWHGSIAHPIPSSAPVHQLSPSRLMLVHGVGASLDDSPTEGTEVWPMAEFLGSNMTTRYFG